MRFSLKLIFMISMIVIGGWAFCQAPAGAPPTQATPAAAVAPASGITTPAATVTPAPSAGGQRGGGRGRFRGNADSQGGEEGQYSMNFYKADVQSVIQFLSMISKVPVVIDPDLKGNVTILSSKKLTLQEAYEVISAALRVRNYTMVGGLDSKVIKVITLKKAVSENTGVGSGKVLTDGNTEQDLMTQVVQLTYASSDDLATQLRPLVSTDSASMVSVPGTNTLIITDTGANIKRLMSIIKNLDVDTLGVITARVYKCVYANSDALATSLNALFQPKTGAAPGGTGNQAGGGGANRGGGPGGGGRGNQNANTPAVNGLASLKGQVNIVSDPRTNYLVITATPDRIDIILGVIKELDVDVVPEVKVKFFPLQFADAQTAAVQLNNMFEQPQGSATSSTAGGFGGFGRPQTPTTTATTATAAYAGLKRNVVTADVRTNSLIVTATAQNMRAFEDMIKGIDTQEVLSKVTNVYALKFARSDDLATTLTNLFRGNTNTTAGRGATGVGGIFGLMANSSQNNSSTPLALLQQITVISNPKTNSLLVTGPPNTDTLIKSMIEQLDKRTAQVFIEVAIVDVSLDKDNQFGVEWQWQDSTSQGSTNFGVNGADNVGGSIVGIATGLKYSILNNNLGALLKSLQTRSDVRVLSTPTITTADNVKALITIGEDIPYVTNSNIGTNGVTNTVDFKTVAISLNVTPHVNGASDVIGLDVDQKINEVIGQNVQLNSPIIANREAQTTVTVKDGQTIAIGGIIQNSKNKTTSGIPILSDIPLIGQLFKRVNNDTSKTELMVFLTPRILHNDQDVAAVSAATRKALSSDVPTDIAPLPQAGSQSVNK